MRVAVCTCAGDSRRVTGTGEKAKGGNVGTLGSVMVDSEEVLEDVLERMLSSGVVARAGLLEGALLESVVSAAESSFETSNFIKA